MLEQHKNTVPNQQVTPKLSVSNDSDFLATIVPDDSIQTDKTGIPVNEIKVRENSFHDDGTDAKDVTTPDFTPTSRRRTPYEAVKQTCQRCSKVVVVNPVHKREFFTCDKCLGK